MDMLTVASLILFVLCLIGFFASLKEYKKYKHGKR